MRQLFAFACISGAGLFLYPAHCKAQAAPDAAPLSKQVANLEEKFARDEKTLLDWPNLARYRDEYWQRAREHGDIRENADYDAAKNEQGHNEARGRQLEEILRALGRGESTETLTASARPSARATWASPGFRAAVSEPMAARMGSSSIPP